MEFLAYVGLLVLLVLVLRLQSRVNNLEDFHRSHPAQPNRPSPTPATAAAATSAQGAASSAQVTQPISPAPSALEAFGAWLKEDWLLKLGALLLLIGFGWLTTYAFLHNWIGPMGRIALGVVAGVLILLLGWWRMKKFVNQGSVFMVLGSTVILLTLFAAREVYGFFTPTAVLLVMFLSTALVAFVSVQYRARSLALASLALAGVAPLLTNTPTPNFVGLFSYLLVVVAGAIWVIVLTRWRVLTTAALVVITLYSLPHLFGFVVADRDTLLLFAYAFAALFFVTNTLGLLKLKGDDIVPDLVTAAGNGLLLLAWIMVAAPEEWQSLIIIVWLVAFSAGAFMIFRLTQRREPFYVYAGVGVVMLAAATAAELEGAVLTIAYTVETAMVSLVAYAVLRDLRVAERVSLLFIGPAILSFESVMSRAWVHNVFHDDFFVLLTLAVSLLGLGGFYLFEHLKEKEKQPSREYFHIGLLVAGSLYAYVLLWLSLHAAFVNDDLAVMASLVIYTLIALVCYFSGGMNGIRELRVYGGVLLGFVVVRLLTIDVWDMDLAGRIVTFFLVGTLLVSTAFIGRQKRIAAP